MHADKEIFQPNYPYSDLYGFMKPYNKVLSGHIQDNLNCS